MNDQQSNSPFSKSYLASLIGMGPDSEKKPGIMDSFTRQYEIFQESSAQIVDISKDIRISSENLNEASENVKDASANYKEATIHASQHICYSLNGLSASITGSMCMWAVVALLKLRRSK